MSEYISSKNNEKIKIVRKLSDKKYRELYGLFTVEGHKLVGEYIKAVCDPAMIFVTEAALDKYKALLENVSTELYLVPEELYLHISEEKAPQGIMAVCPLLSFENNIKDGCTVILESVRDAGNLGTVIRTAAALGVSNVVLSSDCADIYNRKALRAAMGALFYTNIYICDDLVEFVKDAESKGRRVYAAVPDNSACDVRGVTFGANDCIAVGNEGHGLSKAMIDVCSEHLTIPMVPEAESLNASIAASVLMWELIRGRKDV